MYTGSGRHGGKGSEGGFDATDSSEAARPNGDSGEAIQGLVLVGPPLWGGLRRAPTEATPKLRSPSTLMPRKDSPHSLPYSTRSLACVIHPWANPVGLAVPRACRSARIRTL